MKSQLLEGLIQRQNDFNYIVTYNQRPNNSSGKLVIHFNQHSLTIAERDINIERDINTTNIKYYDLIGVFDEKIDENVFKIRLQSFPRRDRCFGQPRRTIQTFQFWVKMNETQITNLKNKFLQIITNRSPSQELKLLVYLNPNAGSNSQKHFQTMQSFLSHTNFTFDVIRTTHRGHCQQHLATVHTNAYQAIIIISGDGLMHQFVNSAACGKIPVSHVPGGSGNAFAKAQMTQAGEECRDEQAIFLVVKGKTRQMNLMKIELQHIDEPIYSFLAFQWAFLADIDLNSQFLRCLGGLRFQIYSVYRCLALRRYRGKLVYSTQTAQLPPLNQQIKDPSYIQADSEYLHVLFCVIPFISDQYQFAPLLNVKDEAIDMQLVTSEHGRWQLIKYLLNSSSGDHFDKQNKRPKEGYDFTYRKIKSFRLEPLGQGEELGLYGIDGERYNAQKMQASMSDKKVLTFG